MTHAFVVGISCFTGSTVEISLWTFWVNGKNLSTQVANPSLLVVLPTISPLHQGDYLFLLEKWCSVWLCWFENSPVDILLYPPAAWLIWQPIPSMRSSILCLCCQLVHCSPKHGLKFLDPLLKMLPDSSGYEVCETLFLLTESANNWMRNNLMVQIMGGSNNGVSAVACLHFEATIVWLLCTFSSSDPGFIRFIESFSFQQSSFTIPIVCWAFESLISWFASSTSFCVLLEPPMTCSLLFLLVNSDCFQNCLPV